MIEEGEARRRILDRVPASGVEIVPLGRGLGRYVSGEVRARVAIPGFDNSAMDGYAVRASDAETGAVLSVVGEQPAGRDLGLMLGEGEAIRIFTGAPMPLGADAVLMQEDAERDGESVRVIDGVESGEFVRRRGSDLCEGQRILARGDRLNPQRIGLLASQGIAEVEVGRLPKVAILSTGDELIQPGNELAPGELYNSNAVMLAEMVRRVERAIVVECFHSRDELAELERTMRAALDWCDILVIAGGVSVGDRDMVKPALEAIGIDTDFWRVRIKPGKPFLFGQAPGGEKLVFGLPGNPVSAFVTFEIFVAPALRRWMGAGEDGHRLQSVRAELVGEVENRGARPHYVRGHWEATMGKFSPSGMQQSHALSGLARSNALLRMEAGEALDKGAQIDVIPVA